MKTALITGITGYIGSNLAKRLIKDGWVVTGIVRDNSSYNYIAEVENEIKLFVFNNNYQDLLNLFLESNFDIVFHLASCIKTNYDIYDIDKLLTGNVLLGSYILECMKLSGCSNFIYTGTYWQHYNSVEYNPVDFYSASKESFSCIVEYYRKAYLFNCICLKLFDVYGENDNRPKLINTLLNIDRPDCPLTLSPGFQILDLVHINDVVKAYICASEILFSGNSFLNEYGVYTNNRLNIRQIIKLIEKKRDRILPVVLGAKPYKNREVMVPIGTLPVLPNWTPRMNFEKWLENL